jgi:hypothetical protein
MVPERYNVPMTARTANDPPSSDWYEVINDWTPSPVPPP